MKKVSLALFLALAVMIAGCKKKETPTSVQFNGSTLYFTSNKVAKKLAWGPVYGLTGATSTTDGKANTDSIVAYFGDGDYPAKRCADLVEGGFNDWYLPSIQELKAISLLEEDLPVDFTGTYWTSTELSSDAAEYWYIHYGSQYNQFKSYEYDCLCTRRD